MTCPRCQGMMVKEYAVPYRYSDTSTWLWACIQCGERVDDMILFNRQVQKAFETVTMKQRERIWMKILCEAAKANG